MLRLRHFLLENRVDFVKKKYPEISTEHDRYAEHTEPGAIVDHFAEKADPTRKKQYTDWIVGRYHKGDFRQEDHERINGALSNFERYKPRLERKDINQYKRLSDVEDAVEPHLGGSASNKEEKRRIKHEGADLVYDDGKMTIHRLKTHDAACHYGAGTKWCTAARDRPDMFNYYNKDGPIHVIQKGGRKWQLHTKSGQLMDEQDHPVSPKNFVFTHPEIQNTDIGNDGTTFGTHFLPENRREEAYDRVLKTGSMWDIKKLVDQTDGKLRDKLIDGGPGAREALASHFHPAGSELDRLAADEHPDVRRATAHMHGHQFRVARALHTDQDERVRSYIGQNTTDPSIQRKLAIDPEISVRRYTAFNGALHPDVINTMSKDKDKDTIVRLIRNTPDHNKHLLHHLIDHADPKVRSAFAEHIATPAHHDKLVDDEEFNVRRAVALKGETRHRDKLVDDPDSHVRYAVAETGNQSQLERLAADEDHSVATAVARRIKRDKLGGMIDKLNGEMSRTWRGGYLASTIAGRLRDKNKDAQTKLLDKIDEIGRHGPLDMHFTWAKKKIAKHGTDEHRDRLINDENHNVRKEVARWGNDNHRDQLVRDPRAAVRHEVAKYGSARHLDVLKDDRVARVADTAKKRLQQI